LRDTCYIPFALEQFCSQTHWRFTMTDATKTPEELAAEAATAATAKAATVAADKAAAKAAAKTKTDAEKAAKKVAAETAKTEAKAKKDADAKAKADAKAAAAAAKETVKQPEQNGVKRPKDGGACGKVWASADEMSKAAGAPVAIKDLSTLLEAQGVNDSTIRTQYALWRKFHGITGRVAPAPVAETPAA
jgi:membrane protein involved in colicin uptake